MQPFTYIRPRSLSQALTAGQGGSTLFKAAGLDVLDRLKERIEAPAQVVDLLSLRAKDAPTTVALEGGDLELDAFATLHDVAHADALQQDAWRALTQAAGEAATPQLRHRATLGGNVLQKSRCWYFRSAAFSCAHDGDQAAGCPAQDGENRYHAVLGATNCPRVHPSNTAIALLALDASLEVKQHDPKQEDGTTRAIPIAALWPDTPDAGVPEHQLAQGEVVTTFRLPKPVAGLRSAYAESREKQSFDWATSAAAVALAQTDGKLTHIAIALGAVGPKPIRATAAEAVLAGKTPNRERLTQAVDAAFADAKPLSQNAYKVRVGKAVLMDALQAALSTTAEQGAK